MNNVSKLNPNNKLKNKLEPNESPESPDWRERLELLFGFLRFHAKHMIGFILVCAVITLVYKLSIQSQDTPIVSKAKPEKSSRNEDSAEPQTFPESSQSARNATEVNSDETLRSESTNPNTDSEFANQSINQLIERSIKIHQTWGKEAPGIGIALCKERARLSQHLLQRKLTESQEIFAITSYIDATSLIDSLNVSSKMQLKGTRTPLVEIDQKYSDHDNDDIAAKANLAISLAPLYKFMVTGAPEQATQFESECRQRLGKIALNNSALTRLADLAIAAHNKLETDSPSAGTFAKLADLLLELPDKQSRRIALQYREHLLYDRFDPRTINLMGGENDTTARQQVKDFFQTLTEHPDSSPQTYRKAVEIIKSFQRLGRTEDTIRLTRWLEQITDQIPLDQNQQTIKKAIQEAINDTNRPR